MSRAIAATPRAMDAIRKADGLPTVIPGGKMRHGAYPANSAAGSALVIAKTTARTATGSYTINLYSRWEADFTVSGAFMTVSGAAMKTPGLNDALAADRLATGSTLLVTPADVAGTIYWVPSYPVGLL